MRSSFQVLCLLLFLLASHVPAGHAQQDSNDPFVIGLAVDAFDKYAMQDHYILDGVNYFQKWCNDQGGLKYGNYTRQVQITSTDASVINPALQSSAVVSAYDGFINQTDIVLSPISTPRTTAAISVSEQYKQINLVVGASADVLFKSNYSYVFSTVVPTSQIPKYSLGGFVGKVNNYVLFSTNDAVSVSVTTSVQTFMNHSGIPLLKAVQIVINTTSDAGLEGQIRAAFMTAMKNVSADLFVCTFPPDDFSVMASAFESVEPDVKAAAFVLPLTRTVQQAAEQGLTGSYWVGATQFDPTTPYGIDGQYGGTSSQFYDDFMSWFNHAPDPYAATAAAALMSYYVALQNAGTVNSTAVKNEMITMPVFDSFLGNISYAPNGLSKSATYLPFQFLDGVGAFLSSGDALSSSIVYPAPWPWLPNNTVVITRVLAPKALAIALGTITGLCMLLALAALIVLLVKPDPFRKQGIFYCIIMVIGILISFAGAIVALPTPTDSLCLAFPWLLGMGFTLVFGCLFIKTWVLLRIFKSASALKSLSLTPMYIARLIGSAILIEAIFLIIWSAVDPPRAQYSLTLAGNKEQLMCSRSNPGFWAVFIAYKGLWLGGCVVMSFMTRNIRADYNESKNIVLAIYNCSIVTIVAVVLAFVLENIPTAVVAIQVLAILIVFTFTLIVLFATPWTNLAQPVPIIRGMTAGEMTSATATASFKASSGSGTTTSSSSG